MFIGNWGRPGITTGHYPEKQPVERSWLEKLYAGSIKSRGPFSLHLPPQAHRFRRQVDQIGASLQDHSLNELKTEAVAIRSLLHRQGFQPHATARSFALIREVVARVQGARPAEEDILAGWGILSGRVVEWDHADKTIAVALVAATTALAGVPVHGVTATDYLARRDADHMAPVYRMLGLSVDSVIAGMELPARQKSYQADITYTTHKQLAFDYLRDRLASEGRRSRLQRQLDRVNDQSERADKLLLRGLCCAIVDEADTVLIDDARSPLVISRNTDNPGSRQVYEKALELAQRLHPSTDFEITEQEDGLHLTSSGRIRIAQMTEGLGGMWSGLERSQELIRQALMALHLFVRDRHYLVEHEKVLVFDDAARKFQVTQSWQRGLNQLLEVKEELPFSGDRETLAKISYQELFQRYLRLGGITSTACEVRHELDRVYGVPVVRVPSPRRPRRRAGAFRLFPDALQKWDAVVARIDALQQAQRPVIVALRSVPMAELLSSMLDRHDIPHHVLTGTQDEEEAARLRHAGKSGRVTLLAGGAARGTAVELGPEIEGTGGLQVIVAEALETFRQARRLIQQCASLEVPGGYEFFISLEDDMMRRFAPGGAVRVAARFGWMGSWVGRALLMATHRAVERHFVKTRKRLLDMDKQSSRMLAFSGRSE